MLNVSDLEEKRLIIDYSMARNVWHKVHMNKLD